MSCDDCDKMQESGSGGLVAFYRWKTANVGLLGCEKHVREIITALNAEQARRRSVQIRRGMQI